jgi:hypothetical protein
MVQRKKKRTVSPEALETLRRTAAHARWVRQEKRAAREAQGVAQPYTKKLKELGITAEQYARHLAALEKPKTRLASSADFTKLDEVKGADPAVVMQVVHMATSGKSVHDPVNNPTHYTDGGIETIDFIEAKRLGFHLGNVVKYICRAGKKGTNMGLQDLQKARWYLDRAIEKNEINPPTR